MTGEAPNGSGSTVSRLERIERLLEKMDDKLDLKAERADLQHVATLVESRIKSIELWRVGQDTIRDQLLPRFYVIENQVRDMQIAATRAEGKAEEAKTLYAKQGFKLDTTAKKIAASGTLIFIVLNSLDTIQNLVRR